MNKQDAIYKLYPTVTKTVGDIAYDKDENIVEYDNDVVEEFIQKEES